MKSFFKGFCPPKNPPTPSTREAKLQCQIDRLQEELKQEREKCMVIEEARNKAVNKVEEKIVHLTMLVLVAEAKAQREKEAHQPRPSTQAVETGPSSRIPSPPPSSPPHIPSIEPISIPITPSPIIPPYHLPLKMNLLLSPFTTSFGSKTSSNPMLSFLANPPTLLITTISHLFL